MFFLRLLFVTVRFAVVDEASKRQHIDLRFFGLIPRRHSKS